KKALKMRDQRIYKVDSYEEFKQRIEDGGFFLCHWDGTTEPEERIKDETKATIRCIPLDGEEEEGVCMVTGRPSKRRVIIARSY
ncbi:MAG: proline--tRNA ligase, partial [Muribaculaceae bacterium]|nr:proline--tRNA ligase [Muribaculaceae bacterium]